MNLFSLLGEYLARHARNLEADTIGHLRAFAAHAESSLSNAVDTVETEVKVFETYLGAKAETVESAVEEIEAHAKDSFTHLLQAQTESPAQ